MKKYVSNFICLALSLVISVSVLSACAQAVSPPENVSAVLKDGCIEVTWEASYDAECYRLYRKSSQITDFKYICDVAECKYTDQSIDGGETYTYKIEAIGENGASEAALSGEVTVSDGSKSEQNAVTVNVPEIGSVTLLNDGTSVVCIDGKDKDAVCEVSRAWSKNGKYTVLGTTEYSSFCDTEAGNKKAYYTVRAVKNGNYSDSSVPVATGTNAKKVFGVPALMYHEFLTSQDVDSGVSFDEYAVWKDDFEKDLIWLRDNGYTTVTSKQLISYINGEATPPKKAVLLTIDDGKYGVYKNAYPLLKKYNMKAVLSVIGAIIDEATADPETRYDPTAPYCTWSEIKEMSDSGCVEIISHTYGFHAFSHDGRTGANCADEETAEHFFQYAIADYLKMQTVFKKNVGTELNVMAYPYSKRSSVSDEAWFKCGYKLLYSGNSADDRKTQMNYFAAGAGVNPTSAVIRRVARMDGTSASQYLTSIK